LPDATEVSGIQSMMRKQPAPHLDSGAETGLCETIMLKQKDASGIFNAVE
jgi:hypothetical protein